MVDKNSPLPIYYQLEEEIRDRIENKELVPGDLIPSEREYAEKHGISRMTVRQAINNLVNDGYLFRQKGKGTYVARNKIEQPLKGLTSFTEEMIARGMSPGSRVLRFEKIASSAKLAGDLQLALDDPVYEIQRVRLADHFPMAIETTYIPAKLVGGLTEKEAEGSLYRFIAEGQPAGIGFAKQVIEASGARAMESQYLGIAEHSPVLLIRRKAFLSDGTPFETVKSVYRADRYKYIIDMNRIQD